MGKTYRSAEPEYTNRFEEIFGPRWKETRDKKKWSKPPSKFKKSRRRSEKAKVKDAMKHEDDIPRFRRSDTWEWN